MSYLHKRRLSKASKNYACDISDLIIQKGEAYVREITNHPHSFKSFKFKKEIAELYDEFCSTVFYVQNPTGFEYQLESTLKGVRKTSPLGLNKAKKITKQYLSLTANKPEPLYRAYRDSTNFIERFFL